jgi:hypothetical protein
LDKRKRIQTQEHGGAVSVASLPPGTPVELEIVVEVAG